MEAEKTGIKIVESPFVISFTEMTKYFKPGLPFDFTVSLLPFTLSHLTSIRLQHIRIHIVKTSLPVLGYRSR